MSGTQTRLWPDARPLVERLGRDFFRTPPVEPGVYQFRDQNYGILYVGKAKSLRKRLNCYRVANPERLPRRLLRLLSLTRSIDWELCDGEAAALIRERELLLSLKPRFNRAEVWARPPCFFAWRVTEQGLELVVSGERAEGWEHYGPFRGGAAHFRARLVRVLWCVLRPSRGISGMPAGWFVGHLPESVALSWGDGPRPAVVAGRLRDLFAGKAEEFAAWVLASVPPALHPFDRIALSADLEEIADSVRGVKGRC